MGGVGDVGEVDGAVGVVVGGGVEGVEEGVVDGGGCAVVAEVVDYYVEHEVLLLCQRDGFLTAREEIC